MIHIHAPSRPIRGRGGFTANTFCGQVTEWEEVIDRCDLEEAKETGLLCRGCYELHERALDLALIWKGWPFQVEYGKRVELERAGLIERRDKSRGSPGSPLWYSYHLSKAGAALLREQCPELFDYKPEPMGPVKPPPTVWERLLGGWNA